MTDKREEIIRLLAKYISDAKCQVFHSHDDVFLADQILSKIFADDQTVELLSEEIEQMLSRWSDVDSAAMAYGNDRPDIADLITAAIQSQASKMIKGDGKTKWVKVKI